MTLTLAVLEAVAPDQAALAAAAKLRNPGKWLRLRHDPATNTIWGECQGSGANPYRVVADVGDQGCKCTCPSRKFPCKHGLALMWMYVENPEGFGTEPLADWGVEWMGRRRRAGKSEEAPASGGRSIDAVTTVETVPEDDPAARERSLAAAVRRRVQTESAIRQGLDELDQWLSDQLHAGMAAFADDAMARCRRIASRLVDAKAAVLASRIDELPARLLALPPALRVQAALHELGQLVLLAQAWRANPEDADTRAAVVQAPPRETVLADAGMRQVPGPWDVLGTEIETRRDGLVSQATWLSHADAPERFACLQDFFPASAGRRQAAFAAGQRIALDLVFHPGRHPLRAVLGTDTRGAAVPPLPRTGTNEDDPLHPHRRHLAQVPWALRTPLRLPAGRIGRDAQAQDWWLPEAGSAALPLAALDEDAPWRGMPIAGAVVIWNGFQAGVLCLDTAHGRVWTHG